MLLVGIDVGAHFHVASFLDGDTPEALAQWKKLPVMRVDISRAGFEALAERVRALGHVEVRVALEPTGRYYSDTIAGFCRDQGWDVNWVENKALHNYRDTKRSPSKTDDMDARLLAVYLYHREQTLLQQSAETLHMRFLIQELTSLNKQRTQYHNRLTQLLRAIWPELKPPGHAKAMLSLLALAPSAAAFRAAFGVGAGADREGANRRSEQPCDLVPVTPGATDATSPTIKALGPGAASLTPRQRAKAYAMLTLAENSVGVNNPQYDTRARHMVAMLAMLDDRIAALEIEIKTTVDAHPDAAVVLSLPGVSHTTAAALIGTYGDIKHYPDKQSFKRRLGVAPNLKESGVSVHSTAINRRSSKYARTALHFACIGNLSPTARANHFKAYFEKHRKDGVKGHNKTVMGRLRGKMAEVLYALLVRGQHYDITKTPSAPDKGPRLRALPGVVLLGRAPVKRARLVQLVRR